MSSLEDALHKRVLEIFCYYLWAVLCTIHQWRGLTALMSLQFTRCWNRSNGIARVLSMPELFESAHRLEGIQVSLTRFDIYMNGMLNQHIVST